MAGKTVYTRIGKEIISSVVQVADQVEPQAPVVEEAPVIEEAPAVEEAPKPKRRRTRAKKTED